MDYHIISVCNCNSNGTTNEVCDKLDGSCICSDGHHGNQCQFGESWNKLCQLVRVNISWDDSLLFLTKYSNKQKYLQSVTVKTA